MRAYVRTQICVFICRICVVSSSYNGVQMFISSIRLDANVQKRLQRYGVLILPCTAHLPISLSKQTG